MDGSATFTMVASSTIISIPTHSTYNASQRLGSVPISAVTSFRLLVVVMVVGKTLVAVKIHRSPKRSRDVGDSSDLIHLDPRLPEAAGVRPGPDNRCRRDAGRRDGGHQRGLDQHLAVERRPAVVTCPERDGCRQARSGADPSHKQPPRVGAELRAMIGGPFDGGGRGVEVPRPDREHDDADLGAELAAEL